MMFPVHMMYDSVWMARHSYDEAVEHYQLMLTRNLTAQVTESHAKSDEPATQIAPPAPILKAADCKTSPLVSEIAKARDSIKQSLSGMTPSKATSEHTQITKLEEENKSFRKLIEDLSKAVSALEVRVQKLEGSTSSTSAPAPTAAPAVKPAGKKSNGDEDDDDDFDMFGDDDDDSEDDEVESEANMKRKEELVRQYNEKKAKKVALIAKSSIILDVKPWDDETDMAEVERLIRTIEMDGLIWGAAKLVPLAYGIKKLQISCVVEDEKVGSEILSEEICNFEDYVQSVDVAAFNKI